MLSKETLESYRRMTPGERLDELFSVIAGRGYTIPEQYTRGWVDEVLTQGQVDETYLRRWAGPLGVEAKLDDVLASRE